jgi:hypothetical protein
MGVKAHPYPKHIHIKPLEFEFALDHQFFLSHFVFSVWLDTKLVAVVLCREFPR